MRKSLKTRAIRTPKKRRFEDAHAAISRKIAHEGIVLLENNGLLPIERGAKIALFGEGAEFTIKGGSGSGEVNCRHSVSIREGLEDAGFQVTTEGWLKDYRDAFASKKEAFRREMRKKSGLFNFSTLEHIMSSPFQNPEGLPIDSKYLTDASDICVFVISRQAGESMDRMPEKGDFLLSDRELENLRACRNHYSRVVIVINIGGYIDLSPIDALAPDAVIFYCQQGGEGGHALADIILGDVTPSGHLASTWPASYGDIPYGSDYSSLNGNTDHEEYREGIYVGYRYFDSFDVSPRYPFGYGLSYTGFDISCEVVLTGNIVTVKANIKNTGRYSGKAVVQVYVSCPAGKLDKEKQRLTGFAKTRALAPDENDICEIAFPVKDLSSFDEERLLWILEPGEYIVRVGAHSRDTSKAAVLTLDKEIVLSTHEKISPLTHPFEELHAPQYAKEDNSDIPHLAIDSMMLTLPYDAPAPADTQAQDDIPASDKDCSFPDDMDSVIEGLNRKELISLVMGMGLDMGIPRVHPFNVPGAAAYSSENLEKHGIPTINFCDGPAGLRLQDESVEFGRALQMTKPVMEGLDYLPTAARYFMIRKPKAGRTFYQYATAFPIGMALAQTWNIKAARAMGLCVQREMRAFGADVWLAPGVNLHRNPLCGRNYEYYSEDPLLSARMAASVIKAVQSKPGYAAAIKHFCCNNQEINRMKISENISQRALRELYLKNFETAIRESSPKCVMTSYNRVNGVYSAENRDLLIEVLRNEWGFEGLIMTDWTTTPYMLDAVKCMNAGVSLMMPGIRSDKIRLMKALKTSELDIDILKKNALRTLRLIAQSNKCSR